MDKNRSKRKTLKGIVVSDKMDKTIVVSIKRIAKHKVYGRVVHRATKLKVHDEKNEAKMNDHVSIMESRPFSKEKRWRLVKVLS